MRQRFNAEEYSKIRDEAKKYFLAKKTDEQDLFSEQSKLFMPIIQSTKDLEKNLISTLSTPEHEQPQLEFGHSSPVASPVASPVVRVNLDGELLNETHRENLQDMSLELPSEVYERNSIQETLKKISKIKRSLGQYLGTSSKRTEKEQEMYQSQKETLKVYKKRINALAESKQFEVKKGEGIKTKKLVKLKRSKGRPKKNPDVIYYKKPDELIEKLSTYCAGKQAGNTGLDNYINSILDELLETEVISKDDYNKIFQNTRRNDH